MPLNVPTSWLVLVLILLFSSVVLLASTQLGENATAHNHRVTPHRPARLPTRVQWGNAETRTQTKEQNMHPLPLSSPSPLSTLRNHRPDGPITVDDAYCKNNEETPDLSLAQRRRLAQAYEGVRAYVMFIGMGRTGHSLVGSLLDAHPHIAVANEADAMAIVRRLYDEEKDTGDGNNATTLDAPDDETEADDDDDDDGSVGSPNRSNTKRKGAARRQRERRAERKKKRVAARQRAAEHQGDRAAQMSQEPRRARGRRGMSESPPPQVLTEQGETIQTWASAVIRDVLRRGRLRNASDYGTVAQLRGRRNALYDELFRNTLRCRTRSGYVYDVPGQYQGQILDDTLYIMGDKKVRRGRRPGQQTEL